jgi:hypothetical protein
MQLRVARVCLDCEEVHDGQKCPVCASETFAFLARWVPVDERRGNRAASQRTAPEAAVSPGAARWVKRGVAGVALFAAGQWLWRAASRPANSTDASRSVPPPPHS